MHLMRASFLLLAALLYWATPLHAQQAPAQQGGSQGDLAQPDPQGERPAAQPMVPQNKMAPERQQEMQNTRQREQQQDSNRRSRTMQFNIPAVVRIAEIPRGQVVTIQGELRSPQQRTFILNDGNSSIVVELGASWQELTKLKAGDRVRAIGQLDPYGSPVFRAGSLMLQNQTIVVVPN